MTRVDAVNALISAAEDSDDSRIVRAVASAVVLMDVSDEIWTSVAPRLIDLAGPALVEALNRTPTSQAARRLEQIARDSASPVAEIAERTLAERESTGLARVPDLLRAVQADPDCLTPPAQEALAGLARLPLEHANIAARTFRRATRNASPDVRFWARLAMARLGKLRAADAVVRMLEQGETPTFLMGNPWTPYDLLKTARPIPPALHERLAGHIGSQHRDVRIFVGALTGLLTAEGRPSPPEPALPTSPPEPRVPTDADRVSAIHAMDELMESGHADTEALWALPAQDAATLMERLITEPGQDEWELITRGNLVVDLSQRLDLSSLPVQEIVTSYVTTDRPRIAESQVAVALGKVGDDNLARSFAELFQSPTFRAYYGDTGWRGQRVSQAASLLFYASWASLTGFIPHLGSGPDVGFSCDASEPEPVPPRPARIRASTAPASW